jgi:metal-responsive CopG/Arc/MetJ family transcriptional regulator
LKKERKTERKLPIGISMPQSLLNEIDTKRGKQSRSEFVVELIEKTKTEEKQILTEVNQ